MSSSPTQKDLPQQHPTTSSRALEHSLLGGEGEKLAVVSSSTHSEVAGVGGGATTQVMTVAPEFVAHATHLPPPSVLNVSTPLKSLYHIAQSLLFTGCVLVTFIFSIFETNNLKIRYFLIQQTTDSSLGTSGTALAGFICACVGLVLLWIGLILVLVSPRVLGKRIAFLNFAGCLSFLIAFCLSVQNASTLNSSIAANIDSGNGNGESTFSSAYGFGLSIAAFSSSMLAGLLSYALINKPIVSGLRPLYIRVSEDEVLDACQNPDQLVGQLISPKDPNFHQGAGFKEIKKDSDDDEDDEHNGGGAGPTLEISSSIGGTSRAGTGHLSQHSPSSPTFMKSPILDSKKVAIAASLGIVATNSTGALITLSSRPLSTIQHPSARPDHDHSPTSSQYIGTTFVSVQPSYRADPVKAHRDALLSSQRGALSALAFTPAPMRKRSVVNGKNETIASVATSTSQPPMSPHAAAMSSSESGMHSLRLTERLTDPAEVGTSKNSSHLEEHLNLPAPYNNNSLIVGDSVPTQPSAAATNSRSVEEDERGSVGGESSGAPLAPENSSMVRVSDLRGYGRQQDEDPNPPLGLMSTSRPEDVDGTLLSGLHQQTLQKPQQPNSYYKNQEAAQQRSSYHTHITSATAAGTTAPPIVFYEPSPAPTCSLLGLTYSIQIILQLAAIALGALAIAAPQYSRTVDSTTPSDSSAFVIQADNQSPATSGAPNLLPPIYTEGWHYYYGSADESPFTQSDGLLYSCSAFSAAFLKAAILTSVACGLQAFVLLLTPFCIIHRVRSVLPIALQVTVLALLLANIAPFVAILEPDSSSEKENGSNLTLTATPSPTTGNNTSICSGSASNVEYSSLVIGKGLIASFIICLLSLVTIAAGLAHRHAYLTLKRRIDEGLESPLLESEDMGKRLVAAGAYEY